MKRCSATRHDEQQLSGIGAAEANGDGDGTRQQSKDKQKAVYKRQDVIEFNWNDYTVEWIDKVCITYGIWRRNARW